MRFFLLVIVAIGYLAYVNSDACVQCSSSTDAKCATNPEAFLAKECANTTSKCYTRVINGNTIRGCATDLDNRTAYRCNNEMDCLICSFMEGCNRQVFPMHRLKCLQCEGNSTNSSCALDVFAQAAVCPIYKFGDKCYIRNTGKNNTAGSFQRGCLSSAQARNLCVDPSNCYTCDGTSCNFLEYSNTQIPKAKDAAQFVGYSVILVFASIVAARFV